MHCPRRRRARFGDEKKPFTMDLMRHLVDTTGLHVTHTENSTVYYVVRKGYPMPDIEAS